MKKQCPVLTADMELYGRLLHNTWDEDFNFTSHSAFDYFKLLGITQDHQPSLHHIALDRDTSTNLNASSTGVGDQNNVNNTGLHIAQNFAYNTTTLSAQNSSLHVAHKIVSHNATGSETKSSHYASKFNSSSYTVTSPGDRR